MNQISFVPQYAPILTRTFKAWCEGCGNMCSTNNTDRVGAICDKCMEADIVEQIFLQKKNFSNNHHKQLIINMRHANIVLSIKEAADIAFKIREFIKNKKIL